MAMNNSTAPSRLVCIFAAPKKRTDPESAPGRFMAQHLKIVIPNAFRNHDA